MGVLVVVGLAAGSAVAEPTPQPSASPALAAIAGGEKPAARPLFSNIPTAPSDVRPFVAWRAAIADIKHLGAVTNAQAVAGPWTLNGTEAWADRARAEASPPAPMTTAAQGDTDAFVKEMLRRATPPPRAH